MERLPPGVDPRTPVIVGGGQVNQRDGEGDLDPIGLIVAAARAAADDAGAPRLLSALGSIRVVRMLSWRYRDPGLLVGEQLGCEGVSTEYSPVGGNCPQDLVAGAATDISAGRVDAVLVGGGEAWRTRMRLRTQGERPDWTRQGDDVPLAPGAPEAPLLSDAEERIGMVAPSAIYPLFEQALRRRADRTVDQQIHHAAELWSRFSSVAARNPAAWYPIERDAAEIATPSDGNRWVAWPYTKLMNANNMVEQSAAILLCSAEVAHRYGIPSERWVFPHASAAANDTTSIIARPAMDRSPAIHVAGRQALRLADVDVDDIGLIDLYSCFPSAVQVAADELGLSTDDPSRPLTLTGGLTFAGGPWNNYVSHALATMASRLRESGDGLALVTANGGYLTKHAIGVYGTAPPKAGFRSTRVQAEADALLPATDAVAAFAGDVTIETWSVEHGRDGTPVSAFLTVRTLDGRRAVGVVREDVATLLEEEQVGRVVVLDADGEARLTDRARA